MSNKQGAGLSNALIIRADANAEMGAGHLMRCLALAQAWKDAGGGATFITACQNEDLLQRLREEGFDIHLLTQPYPDPSDCDYTKDILAGYPSAWIVLDGYHFNEVYQQQVKELGHRLLVIDDMAHLKHYYADIVLNQNLHAEQLQYSCEPYTRLLLGTRYVLLRREFLAWKDWRREIPEVARRVLVTLGGGDPENHTLKVIQALQKLNIPDLEATVIIGASNPHAGVLEAAARQSHIPVCLIRDARNMPELMAWADMGISGGGSTSLEIAYMGLANCTIVLANNQAQLAQAMQQRGMTINLGPYQSVDRVAMAQTIIDLAKRSELRREMSQRGQQLVDGNGGQRVVATILEKSRETVEI